MGVLLKLSAVIDVINEKIGVLCNWLVLLACLVSGGNAMVRYAYDTSSNAWLEVQWYMFAVIVMFGASYTLKRRSEEHTSELQSRRDLVCRLLLEKKKNIKKMPIS